MLQSKISLDNPSSGSWRRVLSGISAQEFGELVGKVNLEADQPNFAVLLGRVMLGEEGSPGGGVSAQHVAAATRCAAPMYKAALVQALVPLCSPALDSAGGALVRQELSRWDQVVCEAHLPPVIAQAP